MIDGTILLICQTVLLVYGQQYVVLTPYATVHTNKQAVAFVDTRIEETTAIYNLHSHNPHDVVIDIEKLHVQLAPARAIFITKEDVDDFDSISGKLDFVQYFSPHKVGKNIWMTNFVITTLIGSEPEIKKLLDSEDPEDQKICNNILKTAVMLHHYASDKPELPPTIGKHCTL